MKNIRFFALLGALAFTACTKSSDDNSNPPNNSALTGSKWVVSYFYDKDKDETSDFAGYSFEFGSNGTLTAYLPDGSVKTGTWTTGSSSIRFTISGTYALDEMNDYWIVLQQTDTELQLVDDNSSHLEALHFKKI